MKNPSSAPLTQLRRRRHATTAVGISAGTALVAGMLLAAAPVSAVTTTNLVVDASTVTRPVTHVASGGLYALATASQPDVSQLLPLHLNQLTQPAPGVQQLGNGATTPSGDALKVAPSAIAAGAQQTIRMADIYNGFPYQWGGWDDYLSKVDTMVQQRANAQDITNINGWELWNEPNGTWPSDAGPFDDGWTRIYHEVRKYDTVTPIVGPSFSDYHHDLMYNFLKDAQAAGTLPDILSWHIWSADSVPGSIADLHGIEDSLGIGRLPISLNEYSAPHYVDVPGQAVHMVSTFERYPEIRDAERSYWYESGTVDGLLYNGKPTGTYWMYKWYGDMTGSMLSVPQNGVQDGIASLDTTRKVLEVIAGGGTGNNNVVVNNLSGFGSTVAVTVNYTPDSGRLQNVAAPTVVYAGTASVTNGTVSVPIYNQDPAGAYEVVITPSGGAVTPYQQRYEAENASISNGIRFGSGNASNGMYVGKLDNSGDARNDSFVDFLVNVPVAGSYGFSIRYANGTGTTSTQGLAYNGGAWSTVSYPATAGWGQFATLNGPNLNLHAGYNMIRLAKGSPYFAGGVGYAELDYITLTAPGTITAPTVSNPAAATFVTRAEAESSTVTDGTVESSANASNNGYVALLNNSDSAVTFTVNVPTAGTYRAQLGYANAAGFAPSGFSSGYYQNGTPNAVVGVKVNGTSQSNLTLPPSGDWGSNGGSFAQNVFTVNLNAGNNTVTITHLDNQNYAELDYLQISSPASAVVR